MLLSQARTTHPNQEIDAIELLLQELLARQSLDEDSVRDWQKAPGAESG